MSHPPRQYGRMTNIIIEWGDEIESEIIIEFGSARLVEMPDGQFEIEGDSEWEKQRAREWAAHFLDVRLPLEV